MTTDQAFHHTPVLLQAAMDYLAPRPGGIYVDCTLGAGGHTQAILERGGTVIGLDRDPDAVAAAGERLSAYRDRVTIVQARFSRLGEVVGELGFVKVDGCLWDLGLSSYQVDSPGRGFAYQTDGPLDMRMGKEGKTAADLLAELDEQELKRVLWEYGEERWAARIAAFIVAARERHPITTTGQLVEIIRDAIPAAARRRGGHPARRTFQALRIAVNDELRELRVSLAAARPLLAPGGRLVAISYHSLEDRIVKTAFLDMVSGGEFDLLTKKPVAPQPEEIQANPRSRSARLRAVEKA